MSSRFNNKKSNGSQNNVSKIQANGQMAKNTHLNKSKTQVFAISSTAFSVCLALSTYTLPALINPAYANGPKGGVVVDGSGDISKLDATTTIINQTSQHMAINWDSYNVASNERVQYIQPNSQSVSLNNILSSNGSVIAGNIDANGKVILVNPNGIVFTQSANINVGSLVASGLSITPDDFINGNYVFDALENSINGDGNGAVINHGIINAATGGSVSLIGKQVENHGYISANLGAVNLAVGKQAVLTFEAGGLLGVRITDEILQEELGLDPALVNSGEINAKGGRVLLTASTSQYVFSQAVNSGIEHATSVVVHADGSFSLGGGADVINSGKVDVSSINVGGNTSGAGQIVVLGENITSSGYLLANVSADSTSFQAGNIEVHAQDTVLLTEQSLTSARGDVANGGAIKVLGDKVALLNDSVIDASGETGGGEILIGGDYRGENDLIRSASASYIAGNTHINANA
ncbi:MAG: filamentous hemagglutinin N-terminal domain-containing protein, partial [Pseudoalteromonas sp.]